MNGEDRKASERIGMAGGKDYLIVGAGFAGSVLAERLARGSGQRVLLVDRRRTSAAMRTDHYDEAGILVHKYGPHIFHTNSKEIFDYLSRFTEWRQYQHKVLASVDGQLLPVPINLDTINRLYGLELNSFQMEEFSPAGPRPRRRSRHPRTWPPAFARYMRGVGLAKASSRRRRLGGDHHSDVARRRVMARRKLDGLGEGLESPSRPVEGLRGRLEAFTEHDELVAAEPGQHVARLAEASRRTTWREDLIADVVPERVVDDLELVQVRGR